jgi:carbon storage regulator
MLVLARKSHETIRIGSDITISVISVRGRIVRVGIDAPQGIKVVRGELLQESAAPSKSEAAAEEEGDEPDCSEDSSEVHSAESFVPPAPLSTQNINRELLLRRVPKSMRPMVPGPQLALRS